MDEYGRYFLLFLTLFMVSQYWLVWRARRRRGDPVPRLDDVIDSRTREQPRLILFFWRPDCPLCGPGCMVIDPLLDEREDIVSIDILEHRGFARRFGVSDAPALVILSQGRIERIVVGSRNEQQIRHLVDAWQTEDDLPGD